MTDNMPAQCKMLVVNADDFGWSAKTNAAVLKAHTQGILTSTSLMVGEEGFHEAVEMARSHPSLAVGLHVVTTFDRSVLPPSEIPLLVNASGKFSANPLRAGLLYSFSSAARTQLRRELEAQFETFLRTGLTWSHADGHQHFHMHPVVWDLFLDLCSIYGVNRFRLPREEMGAHFRDGGAGPDINTAGLFFLNLLRRRCVRTLAKRGLFGGLPPFCNDRVYGTLQSSNMNAEYVKKLLQRLCGEFNEIYAHPGTDYAHRLPVAKPNGAEDVELDALLDPELRQILIRENIRLATYAEAARVAEDRRLDALRQGAHR